MSLINIARVGENILVLGILGFVGWCIYQKTRGKDVFAKFREKTKKIVAGDKDGSGNNEYFR